jgi:hypothetical protein
MKLAYCIVAGLMMSLPSAWAERPAAFTDHGATMTLRGESLLKVGYLFRVYHAGLYVAVSNASSEVLSDVAKRLEIKYLRTIAAADLVEIGDETLARQVPASELVPLRERIATINSWYQDVRAGDQYTLTYVPGHGCELALNGRVLGRIEGADFARIYFGIWLDPRTKYQEFRTNLLKEP